MIVNHQLDTNSQELKAIIKLLQKEKIVYKKVITADSLINYFKNVKLLSDVDSIQKAQPWKLKKVESTSGIRGYNNYFNATLVNNQNDTTIIIFAIKAFKNKLWIHGWSNSKDKKSLKHTSAM